MDGEALSGGGDSIPGAASEAIEYTPTVLYCGNFGNMHDSATLFEYWKQLAATESEGGREPEAVAKALRPASSAHRPSSSILHPPSSVIGPQIS